MGSWWCWSWRCSPLRIRHPEPNGSRWATPPSLIQQRPGQSRLNARVGWTTQDSRIPLSKTTLTPDPVPGARGDHQCRGLTPIHIGGLTPSPRNQSKNLRSPTLTRRRRKTKELFPKGYKNDADRTACHAALDSWKTDKVYAGKTPADQESR